MKTGFDKWWSEEGRSIDPDTSDVSWFDKREELCGYAFKAGVKIGFARAGNYTADDDTNATEIIFANGTKVSVVDGFLKVTREKPNDR